MAPSALRGDVAESRGLENDAVARARRETSARRPKGRAGCTRSVQGHADSGADGARAMGPRAARPDTLHDHGGCPGLLSTDVRSLDGCLRSLDGCSEQTIMGANHHGAGPEQTIMERAWERAWTFQDLLPLSRRHRSAHRVRVEPRTPQRPSVRCPRNSLRATGALTAARERQRRPGTTTRLPASSWARCSGRYFADSAGLAGCRSSDDRAA